MSNTGPQGQPGSMPKKRSSRFDYVKYDNRAIEQQIVAKRMVELVEEVIVNALHDTPRAKENALEALEVCYMWIGKGIRRK